MPEWTPEIGDRAAGLLRRAGAAGLKIVTAESCTGGLIAACLTGIPGASAVFERGFVTYSNAAKAEQLGVDASLIATAGAVSDAVAQAMAEGALEHSRADLAVAVTGIAGPGGATPDKPVGLVHICACRRGGQTLRRTREFGDIGRAEVRAKTVEVALSLLSDLV